MKSLDPKVPVDEYEGLQLPDAVINRGNYSAPVTSGATNFPLGA